MISVIYCTKETKPKHTEHIAKTSGLGKHIEVIEIINQGEALTKAYNRGLKLAKNNIVVYMHDDVTFDTTGWGNKLLKHFEENPEIAIIGLAGTTDIPISGQWWEDRSKMIGIVNHEKDGKKWESKYSKNWGSELKRVVIVDGLFFAVHKERIKKNFDENVEGFHFYELDFCTANYLAKAQAGVIFNIRVTHKSIGMTNEEWDKNRQQFIEKYRENLPLRLVPDFYVPKESSNLSKIPIRVIIQSGNEIDTPETLKGLCDKILAYQYPNLGINIISTDENYDRIKDFNIDRVKVFEGSYNTLPKNLSVLKFDEDFIPKSDELVFFINDEAVILNNIFNNFAKIYSANKNTFGGAFPLSYNVNKTVFSSSLSLFTNKDGRVAIDMKDINTYYNVYYGHFANPMGNLSDCFVTTANNLKILDWFRINYETPLYFNEFALRLHLKNKVVFNDTNSLVIQKSFGGQTNIQADFQNFINEIGQDKKLQSLVKQIG